jgi:predicted Zn-ribbon and HTH transcriptional regulator
MIPRSRLTFDEPKRVWLRYIASCDQTHAAMRDGLTVMTIRCRLCGAAHRCTLFKKPSECSHCGHPLREEGAA